MSCSYPRKLKLIKALAFVLFAIPFNACSLLLMSNLYPCGNEVSQKNLVLDGKSDFGI